MACAANIEFMAKTKERRVWCYLNSSDDQILKQIADSYDGKLNEAAILSVLIGPALRACVERGYRLTEPTNETSRVALNEKRTK